jgi:hypothetical protein
MTPGRRAVVLFATVAIAVAIVAAWLAPAALLDLRIARATDGAVRLANAEGTVRQGHGNVVAGAARIPIAWHVELWPLLRGVVRVQLKSGTGAGTPRATIAVGTDTLAFHAVDVTLPAEVFAPTLTRAAGAVVAGEINLTADDIEWTAGSSRGEARVIWRAARIALPGSAAPLALGEVRTVATADGNVLSGPLGNEGGDLALRGKWTMRMHDSIELALHVTARRPGLPDVERMLSALGTADGNGWRIEWRGTLR